VFSLNQGALRIFRLFKVDVYLHWSWALVAFIELSTRKNTYRSQLWNIAEYVTLFAIVLMHEFGHALACRSVGGKAERIVLWPLGGVAFVSPPARPGAVLWSIAAGPLVNLCLAVPLILLAVFANTLGVSPDVSRYFDSIAIINAGLFIFNMLPIYPLDGGQIVQSLLWFVIGRARSLLVVSILGMASAALVLILGLTRGWIWLSILAAFAALRAWAGFNQARKLSQLASAPRHQEARCPSCGAHPPAGPFWRCRCGHSFDAFAQGQCPNCTRPFASAACTDCSKQAPIDSWRDSPSSASNN